MESLRVKNIIIMFGVLGITVVMAPVFLVLLIAFGIFQRWMPQDPGLPENKQPYDHVKKMALQSGAMVTEEFQGSSNGLYYPHLESIVVFEHDRHGVPQDEPSKLWVLAHEFRHHMHKRSGMFHKYYTEDELGWPQDLDDLEAKHWSVARTALLAEQDCDNFARSIVDTCFPGCKTVYHTRDYPVEFLGIWPTHLVDQVKERTEWVREQIGVS